jgi:hypothetical protein
MARIAPMKTPAQAAADYVAGAGSANAATLWAANLSADLPQVFANASAAAPLWQQEVSSPAALTAYRAGLSKAAANVQPIITKIQGPAKATYSAQVKVAGAPGGNYAAFAAEFLPAVGTEIATLNRTNPRGDFDANVARLNAYLTWLHSQKGQYKQ